MKKVLTSMIFRLTRPPAYHKKSLILSLLGSKLVLHLWSSICYTCRKLSFRPTAFNLTQEQAVRLAHMKDQMDKNGVSIISDYFSDKVFHEITKDFDSMLATESPEPFRGGGYIRTISLNGGNDYPEERRFSRHFVDDPVLISCVEYVHKRKLKVMPRLVLMEIQMESDKANIPERNAVLHADRYFHHAKAFFYLNDLSDTTGAYRYGLGSHRISSFWRLLHEWDLDLRESLAHWRRLLGRSQGELSEANIERIRPWLLKRMGHEVVSMDGAKNSYVFSDNYGFHARGQMGPNAIRRQVHIHFTFVEISLLGRLIRWVVLRFKPNARGLVL